LAREIYAPARGRIDLEHTAPRVSPDGDAIAFYEDYRIVRVALDTGAVRVLREAACEDDLLHSTVRWSPDGRYLAYLDAVEWELPTKLWIMQADGTENRCLIADETRQTKVKSFVWHPYRNRILYVSGPTHGTVSLGGDLCCIDLDGTRRTLVAAELSRGTEVLAEFRVADGLLEYRIAHHSTDGKEPRYSWHKRTLSELD
jgi:dipeptidyl aminopeptidase/acylaminoacyl peptidase